MADPTLPVPNDDPSCRCVLGEPPAVEPEPGTLVVKGTARPGAHVSVTYREDCPHHAVTIAFLRHGLPSKFSVGVHFPPAQRRGSGDAST